MNRVLGASVVACLAVVAVAIGSCSGADVKKEPKWTACGDYDQQDRYCTDWKNHCFLDFGCLSKVNDPDKCGDFLSKKMEVVTNDYIQLTVASKGFDTPFTTLDPILQGSIASYASFAFIQFFIGQKSYSDILGGYAQQGTSESGDRVAWELGGRLQQKIKGESVQILKENVCYFTRYRPATGVEAPKSHYAFAVVRIPRERVTSFVSEIKDAAAAVAKEAAQNKELKDRAVKLYESMEQGETRFDAFPESD